MRVDPPVITGLPVPRSRGPLPVSPPQGGEPRRGEAPPPPERAAPAGPVADRLPSASLAALRVAEPRREGAGEAGPELPALRAFRTVDALDGGAELLSRGGRIDLRV